MVPVVIVFENKFKLLLAQTGALLLTIGKTGVGFTTTETIAGKEVQPFNAAVTK